MNRRRILVSADVAAGLSKAVVTVLQLQGFEPEIVSVREVPLHDPLVDWHKARAREHRRMLEAGLMARVSAAVWHDTRLVSRSPAAHGPARKGKGGKVRRW